MRDWNKLDEEHVWHPFGPLIADPPILIKKAKGCYLYTNEGKKILDMISSWWVNIHGHSNPKIAKAISKQARKMEQVIFAGFTHKPAIKLSESLLELLPKDQEKVFFSDDGSTSVEVAIKLAIQYWSILGEKRRKIIAIEGAYHGDTFGAMSVGDRNIFTAPFDKYMFDVEFIPFPSNEEKTLQALKTAVDDSTAAFIYEPLVQGAAGMRMYRPEVLEAMMSICREEGVVCIADEVMTGFGRTGKVFASDHCVSKPDLYCLSKGITGGFLPLGVTVANKRIVDEFRSDSYHKTFFHGHSYTANPLACAAANASMKITRSQETKDNLARIEQVHSNYMDELKTLANLQDCRNTGTISRIELKTNDSGYTSNLRNRIYRFFLDKGILLRPLGNVIYMIPPYIIGNDDLDYVYGELIEALRNNKFNA